MNLFVDYDGHSKFLNLNPGNPTGTFNYLRPDGTIASHSSSWEDYVRDIKLSSTTHVWTEASTWAEFYELHPEYSV